MPNDWTHEIMCLINKKKGDKLECNSCRGISLLGVYKIMALIIAERIKSYAEEILGEYQSGFRSGRSTTDHIYTIRVGLKKCYEYNIDVHQLYIDYKQAYDSIKRKYIEQTMKDFGIPEKLMKMTLSQTKNKVRKQGKLSKQFEVERGLRQGNPLSPTLFNLVLERCIRKIEINPGGNIYNRTCKQYLAYADDVVILARTQQALDSIPRIRKRRKKGWTKSKQREN